LVSFVSFVSFVVEERSYYAAFRVLRAALDFFFAGA
jgi:hypothetical protein